MLCHSMTRGWRTEGGSAQFSARRHHQAPAFHYACPRTEAFSLEDCVASGSVTPGTAQLLARMIEAKPAFLISGGTGSGKTTLRLRHH
jgi:Flp pilus assembly CpaF family ATPase